MRRCTQCRSTRFSIVTDATIGFSVDDRGNLERTNILDLGSGFSQHMAVCSNGHPVEFKDLTRNHNDGA